MMYDDETNRPYYYTIDRMYNVRSVVDRAGAVVERYAYDPYGRPLIRESVGRGDMDNDTDMDINIDFQRLKIAQLGTIWDPRADLDDDGDVDATDRTLYLTKDNSWPPQSTHATVSQAFSDVRNPFMFQGRPHMVIDTATSATEGELMLNDHRARFNDPVIGRWVTRDPLWYNSFVIKLRVPGQLKVSQSKYNRFSFSGRAQRASWFFSSTNKKGHTPPASLNLTLDQILYQSLKGNPIIKRDPFGLSCDSHCKKAREDRYEDCMDALVEPDEEGGCVILANMAFSQCVADLPEGSCADSSYCMTVAMGCCYPPNHAYLGVNSNCMCKCMGNDPWSKQVRFCLDCYFFHGCSDSESHDTCYEAADQKHDRPVLKLMYCALKCLLTG